MTKYNLIRRTEKQFTTGKVGICWTESFWSESKILETFDSYIEAVLVKLEAESLTPDVILTIEISN